MDGNLRPLINGGYLKKHEKCQLEKKGRRRRRRQGICFENILRLRPCRRPPLVAGWLLLSWWLACWLICWLAAVLLAGWLVGWLVGWLLVGWLVGWTVFLILEASFYYPEACILHLGPPCW